MRLELEFDGIGRFGLDGKFPDVFGGITLHGFRGGGIEPYIFRFY